MNDLYAHRPFQAGRVRTLRSGVLAPRSAALRSGHGTGTGRACTGCEPTPYHTGAINMAHTETKHQGTSMSNLATPTDLGQDARKEVSAGLTKLLADVFCLYVKTRNFHWHVSGPHFRDYHLLLDDQSELVYAMVDPVAERARKLGGTTLRSIGQIASLKRLADNDEPFVAPEAMLDELRRDNESLVKYLRELHELCDAKEDVATASLIENWIDQTEERVWFLFETTRHTH
jgi:starvation-inducible DNA-binding protein